MFICFTVEFHVVLVIREVVYLLYVSSTPYLIVSFLDQPFSISLHVFSEVAHFRIFQGVKFMQT